MRHRVLLLAIAGILAIFPASVLAAEDRTCHSSDGQTVSRAKFTIDRSPPDASVPEFRLHTVAQTNPAGKLLVSGSGFITDGTSHLVLLPENRDSSATCSQAIDNSLALESLTLSFRHARSSERSLATVTPVDYPITQSGSYAAVLRFHNGPFVEFDVNLTVEFESHPGHGNLSSGRR
jgi:hypothetical protein